jgi:hypothetical protein
MRGHHADGATGEREGDSPLMHRLRCPVPSQSNQSTLSAVSEMCSVRQATCVPV